MNHTSPSLPLFAPAAAVLVMAYTANAVLGKNILIIMEKYPYLLTQLSPLSGGLLYFSFCGAMYATGRLPPESRAFPKVKALYVGLLFSLHNVLNNLGGRGNVVPGIVMLVVSKSLVPVSMFLSYLILRKRYTRWHAGGIALLTAGVAVSIVPAFHDGGDDGSGDSRGGASPASVSAEATRIGLLLLAVLPLALAMIYLEVQLKRRHPKLSVTWLWSWICVWEFGTGLLLLPLNAYIQGVPLKEAPLNIRDGLACMGGGGSGDGDDSGCGGIALLYVVSLVPGVAFNLSMGALVRAGSATVMWFVRTFALPVAAVFFTFRFTMGDNALPLTVYDIVGLVLVVVGLVCYVVRPEITLPPKAVTNRDSGNPANGSGSWTGNSRTGSGSGSPHYQAKASVNAV